MSFSFQYYVGEIKTLKFTGPAQGLGHYSSQLLPSGHFKQCNNVANVRDKFDLTLVEKYEYTHILGRSHINELNRLLKPLKSYRLVSDSELHATLENGESFKVVLNSNLTLKITKKA